MSKEFELAKDNWCSHDDWEYADRNAERLFFFTAGRALGRREMKGTVKQIMHDADMAHTAYDDSWYQAKRAIEAIPEEG